MLWTGSEEGEVKCLSKGMTLADIETLQSATV